MPVMKKAVPFCVRCLAAAGLVAALLAAGCSGGSGAGGSGSQALSITAQPAALTVTEGAPASLQVAASGQGTLSYQWFQDGAARAGMDSDTLAIAAASAADAGTYTVLVIDMVGGSGVARLSQPARLGVNVPPTITTQPLDQRNGIGGSVVLAVAAQAPGQLSYQWRHEGLDLPGQVDASLALGPLAAGDGGGYSVVVTHTLDGTRTQTVSRTATLTLAAVDAPVFTLQPRDRTVALGATAAFSYAATATGALTCQWLKDGAELPGATGPVLSLGPVTLGDAGSYQARVTNTLAWGAVSGLSAAARLYVNPGTGSFTMTAVNPPRPVSLSGGQSSVEVFITRTDDTVPVTFGLLDPPAGVSASGEAAGTMDHGTLVIRVAPGVTIGPYDLTVTGDDGVLTRTLPMLLVVIPDING